jgi:precorrin-6B C5,15-methyltransferase / cobalt-precorrin-6B C5,C15-methyltransferase
VKSLTVVGCDGGALPTGAEAALGEATLLVGGARNLSTVDSTAERIVLGDLAAALVRLSTHDGPAVVLASGDPGFFGIVTALRRAGFEPEVLPAPSSVAHAFARLGLAWDDAVVVSAHGRELRRAVNACRAHRKVAVLTGPGAGPAELAAALEGLPRRLVVCSRLNTADERITGPEGDWAEPNVVVVLGDAEVRPARWVAGADPGPAGGRAGWALPESSFAHRDSMITKAEVRALVLARLGPRLGDLVWDIGAGSGSVAVECARLGAAAIAVERDPSGCELVRTNAASHDVDVEVVQASAPAALAGLPEPDAIFVGGGGPAVLDACLARRPSRLVAAYAAVERVGPALAALAQAGYTTEGCQVQANRLTALPSGAHRLAATNPTYLVWGQRP